MYEPDPRRHRSEEEAADFCDCFNCGAHIERSAAYPCSGSDSCIAQFCEGCQRQCASCGLPACEEHMVDFSGHWWCTICLDSYVADQRDAMAVVAMAEELVQGRAS